MANMDNGVEIIKPATTLKYECDHCDWFFNNIFELPLDQTKRRKIGYLGEYIFGAWLIDNNYKICNSKFVVKK